MKIHEWLYNGSATKQAVVEIEQDEIADAESMLRLLDGETGHFGLKVELVSTENPPTISLSKGFKKANGQFGFSSASVLKKLKRYYVVTVDTD